MQIFVWVCRSFTSSAVECLVAKNRLSFCSCASTDAWAITVSWSRWRDIKKRRKRFLKFWVLRPGFSMVQSRQQTSPSDSSKRSTVADKNSLFTSSEIQGLIILQSSSVYRASSHPGHLPSIFYLTLSSLLLTDPTKGIFKF